MKSTEKLRFAILDPLRLVAAFAVIFYHYSIYASSSTAVAIFKYGYLGVNFFFLLSGFVIMASAQNRSAYNFAFARAVRIYPAFIICLLFTVAISYWVEGASISLKDILLNATILNDYLDVANIDGVYWTLQAELKFYGCVFLLLLTGLFGYWRYWIGIWLLIAIAYYFFKQPFFMGWFINPAYSFYFIGGVCAYLISKYPASKYINSLFLVSLIFAFFVAQDQASDFMVDAASKERFIAGICVCLFYIFFYFLAKGFFNINRSSFLLLLGALSYPIYLVHNRAGKAIINHYKEDINIYILIVSVIIFIVLVSFFVNKLEQIIGRWINSVKKIE